MSVQLVISGLTFLTASQGPAEHSFQTFENLQRICSAETETSFVLGYCAGFVDATISVFFSNNSECQKVTPDGMLPHFIQASIAQADLDDYPKEAVSAVEQIIRKLVVC